MICCLNPNCPKPHNPDGTKYCQTCGEIIPPLLRGHYRPIKPLGRGGFGKTYLAEDLDKLNETCVIKQFAPNIQGTWAVNKAIQLFAQEARQLQALGSHPQIPMLYAYFDENNYLYLVQQYIDGEDLFRLLAQKGVWREGEIRQLLDSLLPVLQFIHQRQVIHRDIKPENIIRDRNSGNLVLIDFGVSKQLSGNIATTTIGTRIGSEGYAPLEQIQGGDAYPASDLFSLGVTCFHLLTNFHPFRLYTEYGYTWIADWRSHLPNPVSNDFGQILDKLLAKDIQQRYQSAAEVLQALHPPPPPPPPLPPTIPPRQQIPAQPSFVVGASAPQSSNIGRRKIIQLAGLGGAVAVGAIAIDQFRSIIGRGGDESPTTNFNNSGDKSPTTNLQSFNFDVITLDSQGRENSRNRRSAKFFPQDIGNGITIEMVSISGGTFTMGSPTSEAKRSDDEGPQHSVTISPFYMGKYTVTQAQWRVVAGLPKVNRDLNSDPSYFKGDNLPVEQVNWLDATEFCARLSRYTGKNYRLPTEAEWEYACRAGTNTPFHFGETISTECANYNGNYIYGSGRKGVYREKTTEVGSFQVANNFGLCDMHGNVWEWCEDSWHENYQDAPRDESAWLDTNINNNNQRLLRGGSSYSHPWFCRSATRNRNYWGERSYHDLGFRIVCGVPRTS